MTGARKFRFALIALGCLSVAFSVSAWKGIDSDLFDSYAQWVVWVVVAFGVPNALEHLAGALKVRKGAPAP